MIGPGALADLLAALPVTVERVIAHSGALAVPSYPGGLRPTAIVEIAGGGSSGHGECVAFVDEAQQRFQTRAPQLVRTGSTTIGTAIADGTGPFERAALEAALIDLALRQHRLSLAELTGRRAAQVRWVCSFGADEAPHERMRDLRAHGAGSEFKVDVGPGWSDATLDQLAREPGLAILDFKEADLLVLCGRLVAAFPDVIFEDPPAGCHASRIALDRPLLGLREVEAAAQAGHALNLKAPRMGGFLAVLRALAIAEHHGAPAYFGGMFEVGPGREQARQLAALYSATAPNDLAPFVGGSSSLIGASPSTIELDSVGFGATCDWRALFSQAAWSPKWSS